MSNVLCFAIYFKNIDYSCEITILNIPSFSFFFSFFSFFFFFFFFFEKEEKRRRRRRRIREILLAQTEQVTKEE
jgi:hypothetical protein